MAETIAEKKTRLEILKAQKVALDKKLKDELLRISLQNKRAKTKENAQLKKAEDRRKILIGAMVLTKIAAEDKQGGPMPTRSWLASELPNFLTRDIDREALKDLL